MLQKGIIPNSSQHIKLAERLTRITKESSEKKIVLNLKSEIRIVDLRGSEHNGYIHFTKRRNTMFIVELEQFQDTLVCMNG